LGDFSRRNRILDFGGCLGCAVQVELQNGFHDGIGFAESRWCFGSKVLSYQFNRFPCPGGSIKIAKTFFGDFEYASRLLW